MKKKILLVASIVTISSLFSACSNLNINTNGNSTNTSTDIGSYTSVTDSGVASIESDDNSGSFVISNNSSVTVSSTSGATSSSQASSDTLVYTITQSGTYDLSGTLEGQIYVNLSEDDTEKVVLNLNGLTIRNSSNSPIFVECADKVHINVLAGTKNFVYDDRENQSEESDDESIGNAAIYAKCDMKIKGSGYLYVEGNFNNGIQSKDDLDITDATLYVMAYNNAIKGNDSIDIEDGDITAISTGGDALKTSNSSISSKGNQKGTISIEGGTLHLYACQDAIDAAYDVNISNNPKIYCYTDSYSEYSGEVSSTSEDCLYIRVGSSYYSSSYRYALYYYDSEGNYEWANASYYTSQQYSGGGGGGRPGGGMSTSYIYYYKVALSSKYTNFKIYKFSSSQSENSLTNYVSCSSGNTLNTSQDTMTITESNGKINLYSWSTYSTVSQNQGGGYGPGGMNQGNTKAQDYSTKGIKADNEVVISGGTILINSTDDGIHANADNALENSETPLGNVTISGGTIEIAAGDDGIHADNSVTIDGGTIAITKAYEGIEGQTITYNGGNTTVYASDDGINGSGNSAKVIMTGGYLDVTVPSGDTDTIDSNGTFTMTGGTLFIKNGNGGSGNTGGTFDCDSTISVTGGNVISLGRLDGKISSGATYSTSKTLASGSYSLTDGTNELFSFTTTQSYTAYMLYSSSAVSGVTYTLYKDGTSTGITYKR